MSDDLFIVLRLLAAATAGLTLGLQREVSEKPIGMRTLAMVSLGAAMVSVAAVRYPGLAGEPDAVSRALQGVLQGLMVGVGFIGAGVILRDESTKKVHGLTTATTVWIAAGVGIACGHRRLDGCRGRTGARADHSGGAEEDRAARHARAGTALTFKTRTAASASRAASR